MTRHGTEFRFSNILQHYFRLFCSYLHLGDYIDLLVADCNLCAVYTKALFYALFLYLKEWA
jgi:hypothetical protein